MSTITRTYTFSDGTTAYGSQVESEVANITNTWNLHDAGTNTWTVVRGTNLFAGDGTVGAPSISLTNSPTTGFYRISSNTLGVATNSTLRWQFDSTGSFSTTTGNVILGGDGLVSAPGFSFNNDSDTGIYRIGTNSFGFATNSTLRMFIGATGTIACGTGALPTNTTDGFLYIPTCAGAPSGVPTTVTGLVPLIYDTTNHKFYIYDTAWKGGTNPGAFT